MAYAELSVIVDGALDSDERFHDEVLMNSRIDDIVQDALGDGYPTEIFVMFHEHDDDQDCECAQYEQDHRPKVTVNSDTEGVWNTVA